MQQRSDLVIDHVRHWFKPVMLHRSHLFLVAGAGAFSILVLAGSVGPAGAAVRAQQVATADCESVATCYTPQQLEVAYGVQPLLQRGIDGRGETVVLPELAESRLSSQVSDLRQDFAAFDRLFHLPAPRLKVVSTFPHPAHPWYAFGEEVLDAEVVHSIAPHAALTILLVEGSSLDSANNAVAASVSALRLGASKGGIISLSPAGQIGGEHCVTPAQVDQLNAALEDGAGPPRHRRGGERRRRCGRRGVALITALGGSGPGYSPSKEVDLVTSDPARSQRQRYDARHRQAIRPVPRIGETAWGPPYGDPGSFFQASGGGFSHLFARPSYQNGVQGIGIMRGIPDVAADANSHTGFPVVTGNGGRGYSLSGHAGTSAAAPIWAGIIALADQYAHRHLGFVNPAIYQIGLSPQYDQAFHDITVGDNTAEFPHETIVGYQAGSGWDPVTGWGSPNAEALVPLLARDVSP